MYKRRSDISRDINRLNLKGTEIIYSPILIICNQYNIYIPS